MSKKRNGLHFTPTSWLLLIIIIASHVYFLIFLGSSSWVDSVNYIQTSSFLRSFSTFIDHMGKNQATYRTYGASLIWTFLRHLPDGAIWPTLAISQHLLAAAACFFLFQTINAIWPSRLHLIPCFLLSFLPFYQSFHGMLMTESITSSLLLLLMGLTFRISHLAPGRKSCWAFAIGTLGISLFRIQYLIGPVICFSYILYFQRKRLGFISIALVSASILAAFTWQMLLVSAVSGALTTPSIGIHGILSAYRANPDPSDSACEKLTAFDFPLDVPASKLCSGQFGYSELAKLNSHWRAKGKSRNEIAAISSEIGSILKNDGLKTYINRFRLASASSGLLQALSIGSRDKAVFRTSRTRYTGKELYAHLRNHYAYLSLAHFDSTTYNSIMETHFLNGSFPDLIKYYRAWKQYNKLESKSGEYFRDPFLLGYVPPELWAVAGAIALAVIFFYSKSLFLLFFLPLAAHFALHFSIPYGNIRFAYVIFPLYFVASGLALYYITRTIFAFIAKNKGHPFILLSCFKKI